MDATDLQGMEHQSHLVSTEEQNFKVSLGASAYWTCIDNIPQPELENVRVLPREKVPKYERKQIQLQEQIGKGGQGDVYNARLFGQSSDGEYVALHGNVAVKIFQGKLHENRFGQWPEELFGLHSMCNFVCPFYGYCDDGDSFCLIMYKYDCSLRNNIDKQMEKINYKGRPFECTVAMSIIIKIAVGMAYLHQLNIIHRDLKADNIFINTTKDIDTPAVVNIGDFDVAPTVQGTGFWRAPEILQAIKDGEHRYNRGSMDTSTLKSSLPFTTKSDVYSFGMICYEILTGSIPFEGIKRQNYDLVLHGERPKLPSNLNPMMKDLLSRCWHPDPNFRPTFIEIVSELKILVEEIEVFIPLFDLANTYVNVDASDLESILLKLKQLCHVLLDKYNREDFVILASEVVDGIEKFKIEFGLQSFKEHPSLPFSKGFSRHILFQTISLKFNLFMVACPQVIPEIIPFNMLFKLIFYDAIHNDMREALASKGCTIDIEKNLTAEEIANRVAMFKGIEDFEEEHRQSSVYVLRHAACHELLTNKHYIGRTYDEIQPCDFCKNLPIYAPKSSDFKINTFHLYRD